MSSPNVPGVSAADWRQLPTPQRVLLLAVYFVEGLGLASLPAFFTESAWSLRFGLLAACILPQLVVYWRRPGL
jgi:hypothetical protein